MPTEFIQNGSGLDRREWNALIGIVTAIIGNILISFALNIQRYAHIRLNDEQRQKRMSWRADRQKKKKVADIPGYGSQLAIAEERAEANRVAPRLDEEDGAHQAAYHGAHSNEEADERTQSHNSNSHRRLSSSTVQVKEEDSDKAPGGKSYLKSPYWWAGIILMTVGEAGNFIAYGFAPASIVSPLGVVALISNCIVAPLLLKERFRQRDFWGVLIAVGGAVTVVLSARTTDPKLGPDDIWDAITRWEFELYLGITAVLILILMWASGRYGERSILIDIGLVGLFGGYTALSTKGVASLLTDTVWRAVTFPIFYLLVLILVVTAVLQIRYINRALARFDSTRVVPTQFVCFTISVIIGSAVLYREFESTTGDRVGKFVGGCALTFLGVYLITSGKRDDQSNNENDEESGSFGGINLIDDEVQSNDACGDHGMASTAVISRKTSTQEQDQTIDKSPPMSEFQTGKGPVPIRPLSDMSAASTSYVGANTDGASPFLDTSWTRGERPVDQSLSQSHKAVSAPVLAVEARVARPSTPANRAQTHAPNPNTSSVSRGSISHLIPGPISSPLSSSLSAIVADQIRRGVEVTPRRARGSLRRAHSNVLDAEDTGQPSESQSLLPRNNRKRAKSVSETFNDLLKIGRSKSDKGPDLERGDED